MNHGFSYDFINSCTQQFIFPSSHKTTNIIAFCHKNYHISMINVKINFYMYVTFTSQYLFNKTVLLRDRKRRTAHAVVPIPTSRSIHHVSCQWGVPQCPMPCSGGGTPCPVPCSGGGGDNLCPVPCLWGPCYGVNPL